MTGMEMCQAFFEKCVSPILAAACPGMKYSAGLVGFGSDVLGYDDRMRAEHPDHIHNECGITKPINSAIRPYFTRDIKVVPADAVAEAIRV